MLLAAAKDWTLVFVGLEIVTITFYILVAYQRNQPKALEASVKYLIIGALSTGVLVFGMAFLFGITRSTQLDALAFYLADGGAESATLRLAMVLVLAGIGFKLAAVPFHGWAPDVYQGAPTPITGFLATASKAVGLVLLIRIFYLSGFGVDQLGEPLTRVISWIAGASLILGSLAAIPQTNLKRLLGYSSITHAGFLLLALSCCQDGSVRGLEAALIYILLYVPAALLAFFILSAASRQLPGGEISALAGLGRRSPVLAFGMLSALVSMAGIPPLAGFVGKFAVLAAAWESGAYALFVVGVVAAVAGVYYYLGAVKAMYWDSGEKQESFEPSPGTRLAVVLLSGFLLLLGFWPAPLGGLVGWIFQAV
jgi:NADH-quinone oxidoreductase subunit N